MNTNAVADAVLEILEQKHSRVYRNAPPKTPIKPYIIYKTDSSTDTSPSDDIYIYIDIYDASENLSRDIEDLADTIENTLNGMIVNTEVVNIQFEKEQRQYIGPEELVSVQMINMRYILRVYFK